MHFKQILHKSKHTKMINWTPQPFLLKNNLEDIWSPFCGATDTPVLDFWYLTEAYV